MNSPPASRILPRLGLLALGALVAVSAPALGQSGSRRGEPITSERATFRVVDFATGLADPWGGAFLPDGRLLVTEQPGRMRLIARDGTVSQPLAGVPVIETGGQGGLLDVALAPDFANTREIYFCHSAVVQGADARGALTRLVRARLSPDATALEAVTPLLDATPPQNQGRNHFGCRIVFGPDGALFLSTGDRYVTKQRAQRRDDLAGKVLRLNRDGAALADNPLVGQPGTRPEIYSFGHRNPQGLAVNPATGSLWEVEFGPRGGDEVNVLRPGGNYGWPVVTHGIDYDGSRIGEGTSRPDMVDPIKVWTPVVSPSGVAFYTGEAFPGWRGNLFLAALRTPGLVRLTTEGDRVTGEERLLWGQTRLRQVIPGPDGLLYILTDESSGRVLRLQPG